MGYKERTVGGGPAKGLANDFVSFLQNFITSGKFGGAETRGGIGGSSATSQFNAENPMADSAGIFGLLNSIISNPQADKSVQDLISKDVERGRNDLRARFGASGGMAYGSPAAFAESLYQAEQTPRTALALDQMAQSRIGALMPFFQMLMNTSSLGIPQAQTTMEPSKWMQGFNMLLDTANTVANFIPFAGGGETNARAASMPVPKPAMVQQSINNPMPYVRPENLRFIPTPSSSPGWA